MACRQEPASWRGDDGPIGLCRSCEWQREIVPAVFSAATWELAKAVQLAAVVEPLEMSGVYGDDGNFIDAGVVLIGPAGVGKTYTVVAMGREWWDHGADVVFTTVSDMLADLRPIGDGAGRYIEPELLILDDIGAERLTEWGEAQVLTVVDGRWRDRRVTYVTSNLEPGAIADHVGDRTWDRLRDGAVVVRLSGPSLRQHAPMLRAVR